MRDAVIGCGDGGSGHHLTHAWESADRWDHVAEVEHTKHWSKWMMIIVMVMAMVMIKCSSLEKKKEKNKIAQGKGILDRSILFCHSRHQWV